jgi:hypothetical protein
MAFTHLLILISSSTPAARYKTGHPDRARAKKFLAPAFSTNNLQKTTLDILYRRLQSTIMKFSRNAQKKETIDVKNVISPFVPLCILTAHSLVFHHADL